MGSGLPGSLPSYLLCHLLLYISYLANKIVVVRVYAEQTVVYRLAAQSNSIIFLVCFIHTTAEVSEGTNKNLHVRNTLVQLLTLHTNPESHNARRHRQTDRRTTG